MPEDWRREEYHTITPYAYVKGADDFIRFLETAFGGTTGEAMRTPTGEVAHAEVHIGDSVLMLGENEPRPANYYLYVQDVDGTYRRALSAGASSEQEPANQFYGDRTANVRDRWGNLWFLASRVEDVPPEEMQRRMMAARA